MASGFSEQKPDPAIKKNVMKARQSAKNAKRAQSFVVAVSMAATLLGSEPGGLPGEGSSLSSSPHE